MHIRKDYIRLSQDIKLDILANYVRSVLSSWTCEATELTS